MGSVKMFLLLLNFLIYSASGLCYVELTTALFSSNCATLFTADQVTGVVAKCNEMYANVTFTAEQAALSGFTMCSTSVSSTDGSMVVAMAGLTQLACDGILAAPVDTCIPNEDQYTSTEFSSYKITSMDVDSDVTECPTRSSANVLGLSAFGLISIVAFFN